MIIELFVQKNFNKIKYCLESGEEALYHGVNDVEPDVFISV